MKKFFGILLVLIIAAYTFSSKQKVEENVIELKSIEVVEVADIDLTAKQIDSTGAWYKAVDIDIKLSNDSIHTIEVDLNLEEDFREYLRLAEARRINVDSLKNMNGLYLLPFSKIGLSQHSFGITKTWSDKPTRVFINSELIPPYLPGFLNAVVYHELGHVMMSSTTHPEGKDVPMMMLAGDKIEVEEVIRRWGELEKITYFEYLAKKLKMKRWEADFVMATVYNAVPEQCNEDPGHTAFMYKLDLENPFKHGYIAVSRDLLIKYPGGTRVRIEGTCYDGTYIVGDKMNKRYKKRIDILINNDMPIGKWDNIKITKLGL